MAITGDTVNDRHFFDLLDNEWTTTTEDFLMATFNKHQAADGTVTHRVRIRMKGHPVQTATFRRLTDAWRWAQETATRPAVRATDSGEY